MTVFVQRRLELALTLFAKPYAWRCSVCLRLFAVRGMDPDLEELGVVDHEFRIHRCRPATKEDPTNLSKPSMRDLASWDKATR
jgi:hypothetical protein